MALIIHYQNRSFKYFYNCLIIITKDLIATNKQIKHMLDSIKSKNLVCKTIFTEVGFAHATTQLAQ